jgi:hypothetical protein
MVERLIPLAARAAADEVRAFRVREEDPASAVARLDDLRRRYPTIVSDLGFQGPVFRLQMQAMQAWYDAEVVRGRENPAAATAWQHAAHACADAGLAWDEAYACWRTAEALAKDRASRDAAAAALRRAYEFAVDLQAAPLLAEVKALAQGPRISLAAIDDSPRPETTVLPGLTAASGRSLLTSSPAAATARSPVNW